MEKLLNPYDKEYMKMAMLKHEETFKQQVHELHRLYKVQKILMKNMEIKNGFIRKIDVHNFDTQQNSRKKLNLDRRDNKIDASDIEIMEESEIELTLGPSCYGSRRKKRLPKMPLDSDSGLSFSSSSSGSINGVNERGNIVTTARKESRNGELEEQLKQERLKQQPWLYQVFSLNIT